MLFEVGFQLSMASSKVVVVAAHPDDETLGMGGSIRKLSDSGIDVTVLFLADGVTSRSMIRESIASRRNASLLALRLLGCTNVVFGDFPDNSLDTVPFLEICQWIENQFKQINPTTVFTHFPRDLNIDHRIVAEATTVASRPKADCSITELYFFEVLSSTGWAFGSPAFDPKYFVNIESVFQAKIDALKCYEVEMDEFPGARSLQAVEALATTRGAFVGFSKSEAFEIGFIRSNDF